MAKKKANQSADKPAAKATASKALSAEDRNALNDRARYDYGILNAADMSEKQLNSEIAAVDKQAADAKKEDAKTVQTDAQNAQSDNQV